jgi:hypothetical protein
MNQDQLEALLHIILGGIATFCIGKGYIDQSGATQVVGGVTALVTAFLAYKTNTAAAVATSAAANAAKVAPKPAVTPPPAS